MKCQLFAYSTSPHVSQLYTGFSLLALNGEIGLSQTLNNARYRGEKLMANLEPHALNGLFVLLNNEKLVFYDTSDTADLYAAALAIATVYFKRSYLQSLIPKEYQSKVFPLGLNYEVYTGRFERHELARILLRKRVLKRFPIELLRYIGEICSLSFLPTMVNMSCPPKRSEQARVLFIARAWDPNGEGITLPKEQREERIQLNLTRARCIELLRSELGHYFYGGFVQDKYATSRFKHLLVENAFTSEKRNYVSLLRQHQICIATAGLHGSIGWKMAEYVAFSKSIVTENIKYSVPCGFSPCSNYLEFDTPEQCLRQTVRLFEDVEIRSQMMENNWEYYNAHLRPDKLILRTLKIASDM